jgi:hypothetical protein
MRSNIGLCITVKVSLICSFCLLKSYMWKRSGVFSNWPFLFMYSTSIVSLIVLYACPVSSMCKAYIEACLFVFMAWICSLYRGLNVLPVCLMYLSEHSLFYLVYSTLIIYVSYLFSWLRWFFIVLVVVKAIPMSLLLIIVQSFLFLNLNMWRWPILFSVSLWIFRSKALFLCWMYYLLFGSSWRQPLETHDQNFYFSPERLQL